MQWHILQEFSALRLILHGQQKYRTIRSLPEAAELLITEWPAQDGEAYVIAVRACLDALNGTIPVAEARAAFVRAADEDGIAHFSIVD